MEAFPPGSDQLPSWENHSLGSTPMPAGDTLHSAMKRERKERTAFDIILGSNLIQFEFSYPTHSRMYCYLSGRLRSFTVV